MLTNGNAAEVLPVPDTELMAPKVKVGDEAEVKIKVTVEVMCKDCSSIADFFTYQTRIWKGSVSGVTVWGYEFELSEPQTQVL